ncbi:hypothetical protein BHYA_0062g00450 [Botrytis hyacinthi]|uniref:Uncharacterized protein n=1 Tax=Botrytis hyacinthi TaxID=278943 RepID=A0A4Z1GV48_9HELO|nr:hypothetical protein BHYA_0062g00450 [Botrytis hyacinthi]
MADMASVGNNVKISHDSPIPGTVHLIDLDGTLLTKHASGSAKEVVLVPPPSSHPDDPLNWSPKHKALSTFCICLYVLAVGFPCSAIYSLGRKAMVIVMIIRNMMSFAINYSITPCILNTDYQNTFVAAAFISLAQVLVFLIFVKWGKGWRAGSKERHWTMVEDSAKRGLAH